MTVLSGYNRSYWVIPVALCLYLVLAHTMHFVQDDAYISYRYVANYLNGHGLVYNLGERVEGITNFGWTVTMLLPGVLGGDFMWWSKVLGLIFGGGIIGLTFVLARDLLGRQETLLISVTTLLVGINQSLAYWSPAGLETAAFAFFALLALLLYVRRNWLLIFALTMAVWIRPEGAVVTVILVAIEYVQTRSWPRFSLWCAMTAFVLSLPFVGFKLWYYGSILPNPFYAKTSFDLEQLTNGLEYAGRFARHYAFYYVGLAALVVPVAFRGRVNSHLRALWLFVVFYFAYIILIGGDVLKVHRFFLPLFGTIAVLMVFTVQMAVARFRKKTRTLLILPVALVMLILTFELPRSFVLRYNELERAFTDKMQYKAQAMKRSDPRNFSVAVATIGIFGYELLGHEIIDMVGLTDSTIARYSEDPVPGMVTTWKEQKHNSRYILQRAPDYIMFSTGIKPSAPAERALLLYPQFQDSYRTIGWYYQRPGIGRGVISSVFKRVRPIEGEIVPVYPVEYVQEYKEALDAYSLGDHRTALRHYEAALRASPRPYYVYLVYQMAFSLQMLGNYDRAYSIYEALLKRDSTIFEAHMELYRHAALTGDSAKMAVHKEWLLKLVPWYWPRIDSTVQAIIYQLR